MSVKIGDRAVIAQTLTEDILQTFCEITQDLDPLHVDERFAASTPYGRRIAPGGLIIGWMLAAAAKTTGHHDVAVPSVGFNRVRHVAPVYLGDSVEIVYTVTQLNGDRGLASVVVCDHEGSTVAVGEHVFKILR